MAYSDRLQAGYIDNAGAWVIPPAFESARAVSEGLAAARDDETELWGYIDRSGRWVIEHADGITVRKIDADPNRGVVVRGESYMPLRVALEMGHTEVAVLLRQAGGEEAPAREKEFATSRDFEENFASCTPGATFTSSVAGLGASVRYEIQVPKGNGCRVSLTFESNPNSEWENKPLMLTLNQQQAFLEQFEEGMQSCMSGGDPRFDCAGPLLELLRPSHLDASSGSQDLLLSAPHASAGLAPGIMRMG